MPAGPSASSPGMAMEAAEYSISYQKSLSSEIVILFGLARRTARKSRKYHYFTLVRAPDVGGHGGCVEHELAAVLRVLLHLHAHEAQGAGGVL